MNVVKKDAVITATGTDEDFPGTFEVILSAPTLDRDGETLYPEEWQLPLPDKINFDTDHGMSVDTTVGSGVPTILDDGRMKVAGTYSSLPRAQDLRTLVKEGHIDRTSVAFASTRTTKDGKTTVKRELLNGAFVAVPANREAVVLSSKGAKSGARHSATDLDYIKQIRDLAALLLSDSTIPEGDLTKAVARATFKAVAGSYEANQAAVSDALSAIYTGDSVWAYPVATYPDSVVFHVSGNDDAGEWQASYSLNADGTATLGTPERVKLVEQIVSASEEAEPAEKADPAAAEKSPAAASTTKAAEADSPTDEELGAKALEIIAGQFS